MTVTTACIIIYIIGFLTSYIWAKFVDEDAKQELNNTDRWKNIGIRFVLSLFSWCMVALLLIVTLIAWVVNDLKPPKWL